MGEPIRRRRLPAFRSEIIGQEEAFAEGERERRERLRANRPDVRRLPLVGGPHDGGGFLVPAGLLRGDGEQEFPIRIAAMSERIIVPGERPRSAVYRLDRTMGVLRFTGKTITLNGGF